MKMHLALGAVALIGLGSLCCCQANPEPPPAPQQSIQDQSCLALAKAGLDRDAFAILKSLHKLKEAGKCVVRFEHFAYEWDATILDADEVIQDAGWMILLKRDGNSVIALANRCAVDFHYNFKFRDPAEGNSPEFLSGFIRLDGGDQGDFYTVTRETDRSCLGFKDPSWFGGDYLVRMKIGSTGFLHVTASGDRVSIQPIDRHDLALVTFEWNPGSDNFFTQGRLQTLELEDPAAILYPILQGLDSLRVLGRRQLIACERCVADGDLAQPEKPMDILDILPFVAGIVAGPEAASVAEIFKTFVSACQWLSEVIAELKDLKFSEPAISLSPAAVKVLSGDEIETPAGKVRLAYVQSASEDAAEFLRQAFAGAKNVTLIPDGRDWKGGLYGHVLIDGAYLNLVLVFKKLARSWDHWGDGRGATRFILRAFRALE